MSRWKTSSAGGGVNRRSTSVHAAGAGALELAQREAFQLGHGRVGTEHLLLGLLREGRNVAAQVVVTLGGDLSRVRQQVFQLRMDAQDGAA